MNEQRNLLALGITILFFAGIISYDFLSNLDSSPNTASAKTELVAQPESVEPNYINYPFGIKVLDSLTQIKKTIKKNDTFYSILLDAGVPMTSIHELVLASKNLFDTRRINIKKNYYVFYEEKVKSPRYFVYEESPKEYIKVEFSIPIRVERGRRESYFKEFIVSSTIHQTLYTSLTENKLDGRIANQIADLMAWQIDFHRIQKGDSYQIILEQEFVGEKPTGEYAIKALRFNHAREPFYAFRYNDEGITRYFDEKGNSLEKTFLKAPLKFSRVSSGFSQKRFHPVLKYTRPHLGIDYAAPKGTPVYAVADGVITEAGYGKTNGNYVRIKHNSTSETGYLHFTRIAPGITKGKKVRQGQVIGYVGDTGLATGPHLCFRFWKNGQLVNPAKQYNPPARPIDDALRNKFLSHIKLTKQQLDRLNRENARNDIADLTAL